MMDEKLLRKELPIQSIYQRGQAVTAIVPVHQAIIDLPRKIRTDTALLHDARDAIKQWYNEDMKQYLKVLQETGTELPWLQGYEHFQETWELTGMPDRYGFLLLSWREQKRNHTIKFNSIPLVLCNQHDDHGEFYTPDSLTDNGRLIEIIYRNVDDPEIIVMHPAKLAKYGKPISIKDGLVEVMGHAFISEYHSNMARALLLRNFAVFYLNTLFDTI